MVSYIYIWKSTKNQHLILYLTTYNLLNKHTHEQTIALFLFPSFIVLFDAILSSTSTNQYPSA